MTITELKKKCDEMIADGFGDSEVFLHMGNAFDDVFFPLDAGFSSVTYNEGAREQIFEYIVDEDAEYEMSDEQIEEKIEELGIDTGSFVILN